MHLTDGAQRALHIIILSAVGLAWLTSASGNYLHALQWAGGSGHAAHVAGALSVATDILKACLIIAIGILWRHRAYAAMLVAIMIWTMTAAWSMKSASGLAAYMLDATTAQRTLAASNTSSRRDEVENLTHLLAQANTMAIESKRQSDRAAAEKQVARLEQRLDWARGTSSQLPPAMAADPLAALLGRLTGVDGDTVTAASVFGFMVIVEVVAGLGFFVAAPLVAGWRRRAEPEPTEDDVAEVDDFDPAAIVMSAELQCKMFIADLASQNGGKTLLKSDVFDLYAKWAQAKGFRAMANSTLGSHLTAQGVREGPRIKNRRTYAVPSATRQALSLVSG